MEKLFDINLIDEVSFFAPSGKAGELFEIPVLHESTAIDRLYLVGVGEGTLKDFRAAGAALGRKVKGKAVHLISFVPVKKSEVKAHAISIILGSYAWNLKTGTPSEIPTFSIGTSETDAVAEADSIAQALVTARDLIHTPSNIKTPLWMAQEAKKVADAKGLSIKVLEGKELVEFGGLVAVGGSSPNPGPRFIEISYVPKKIAKAKAKGASALPHVVVVGKGITYDTGGVSLKRPYDIMIPMQSDMAGAAACLAVMSALKDLKANVKVTALLMCAENAISGTAQRPGDVITHYGGKTVEVLNTDAEGRLVLADGLAYAVKNLKPDYLIDIATLTGSATLGLGKQYAALYSRNIKWIKDLRQAGEISGDRVWHMPLIDDYEVALESDIADINHTADKGDFNAGSVTAALFLEQFVDKTNWAHLDIAGVGRAEADSGENPKGGTGWGVRLLLEWIGTFK